MNTIKFETRRTFSVVGEGRFWNSIPLRHVEAKIIQILSKTKLCKGVTMTWWLEQGAD